MAQTASRVSTKFSALIPSQPNQLQASRSNPIIFGEIRRMKMASKSTTRVISDDQILGGAPVVSDKHLSS
jgi:hypothetical protein